MMEIVEGTCLDAGPIVDGHGSFPPLPETTLLPARIITRRQPFRSGISSCPRTPAVAGAKSASGCTAGRWGVSCAPRLLGAGGNRTHAHVPAVVSDARGHFVGRFLATRPVGGEAGSCRAGQGDDSPGTRPPR